MLSLSVSELALLVALTTAPGRWLPQWHLGHLLSFVSGVNMPGERVAVTPGSQIPNSPQTEFITGSPKPGPFLMSLFGFMVFNL